MRDYESDPRVLSQMYTNFEYADRYMLLVMGESRSNITLPQATVYRIITDEGLPNPYHLYVELWTTRYFRNQVGYLNFEEINDKQTMIIPSTSDPRKNTTKK
ncbi:hypothetical protein HUJ05_006641 [Dendroctonus ponderosae]|nr:hypothetical protein HUJ05_006641 [Dendroctonus ponderosae]